MSEVSQTDRLGSDLLLELQEARRKQHNSELLLQAAQAIPMAETFTESARAIFDACCEVTGASAGYVALLSATGEENEVLFLEAGGLPCSVDPSLPMPIRGLRGVSYDTNKAVYDNDFSHSKWMKYMPEGHVTLKNVMFSPVVVSGKAVGLIGLANKKADFTDADAEVATTFGELAAVALRFARYQDELRRWSHVFEHAEWGVAVVDPDNVSLNMINPAFAAMHGYGIEELASKPLEMIWAPEEHQALKGHLARLQQQDHYSFETIHLRQDGSQFPVLVDVTAVDEVTEQTEGHESMEEESRRYYVFNVQDITSRKAAEKALQRFNVELAEYAGVAAHELQEPLRLISSYTQLLGKRYRGKLDADADEFIEYASGAADRLQRLLEGLLVYSRVGSENHPLQTVDCEDLLREVKGQLHEPIRDSGARIEHEPLPRVSANRYELGLLFQHLLSNALHYAGNQIPQIRISAKPEKAGWWQFTVGDQGIGIAPRHQERIFGLFTRLQGPAEGHGTGIGLALCRKVVERYGGRLWLESEEGEGAQFHFTLPGADSK